MSINNEPAELSSMSNDNNEPAESLRPVPRGSFSFDSSCFHLNRGDSEFPDRVEIDIYKRTIGEYPIITYHARVNSPHELGLNCSKFDLRTMVVDCVTAHLSDKMNENVWMTLEPGDSLINEMRLNATFKHGENQFKLTFNYIAPPNAFTSATATTSESMNKLVERRLVETHKAILIDCIISSSCVALVLTLIWILFLG